MELIDQVFVGLMAAFFLLSLLRIFRSPLRLALKVLGNTLLGFLALWGVNLTATLTGISLGMNLWNALTVGVLGLPGLILLLTLQWVLR